MTTIVKSYRFRLEPTAREQPRLAQMAGARRFVWNWGLERKTAHYQAAGVNLPRSELSRELTRLKMRPGYEWLADVDSQALQQALTDLHEAFRAYFDGHSGFPRFKSKKGSPPTFRIPQRVRIEGSRIRVPKVGFVRLRLSRPVVGNMKSATFKRDACGHWHVTVVTHHTLNVTPSERIPADRAVGLDLGIRSLATLSDGARVDNPQFLRMSERRLKRAHRELARKQRGSRSRSRQRLRVARLHQQAARRRGDLLHKLTTGLLDEYDAVIIEDLNVRGLARSKLSKSVHDAAFAELRRQLTYKAMWRGKHLVAVDRYYPSSQLCSSCGRQNRTLRSNQRVWSCPCGTDHDRDHNAALNLLAEGMRIMRAAAGHADAPNARGASVGLPMGAAGAEAGTPTHSASGDAKSEVLYRWAVGNTAQDPSARR